ncbi:MAG: peptidoglycan DD-metalloendopeptidase family protein [Agromyces sp.]
MQQRSIRGAIAIVSAILVGALPLPASAAMGVPWPIPQARVIRGYAPPAQNWLPGHRGIDLRAPSGTRVSSPVTGTVRFAGRIANRDVLSLKAATGEVITFEPVESSVATGEPIRVGQTIGRVSVGGHCGTTCLHVGVLVHGNYISPLRFFRVPRARLLPLTPTRP